MNKLFMLLLSIILLVGAYLLKKYFFESMELVSLYTKDPLNLVENDLVKEGLFAPIQNVDTRGLPQNFQTQGVFGPKPLNEIDSEYPKILQSIPLDYLKKN